MTIVFSSSPVALGERRLIRLFLDHLLVAPQRQRREAVFAPGLPTHVVAVGQSEVAVESVTGGQELGLVAQVPFANQLGGIALPLEKRGDRLLLRVQSL